MRSKQELLQLVQNESILIKELESVPFRQDDTNWQIHLVRIQDAYWRRRNWKTKLQELGDNCDS